MASDSQAPGSPLTPMTSASLLPEKSPEPPEPPDPDAAETPVDPPLDPAASDEEVLRSKCGGSDGPASSAVPSLASEHPNSNGMLKNARGIAIRVLVRDDMGNSSWVSDLRASGPTA